MSAEAKYVHAVAASMAKPRKSIRRTSSPRLVYFEDRGAVYDAPIETVWDFMRQDEEFHPKAHASSVRNFKDTRLSAVTVLLKWEELKGGRWKKRVARMTEIRPSVRILEELEGPDAGSQTVHTYSPRGNTTVVDVLSYRRSTRESPALIKRKWLRRFAKAYREDLPYFRQYVRKRRVANKNAA